MLGFSGTVVLLSATYFFGPAIAFGFSRYGRSRRLRYCIAAVILAAMIGIAYGTVYVVEAPPMAIGVILGTVCCWTPQTAVIYCIHAAWKSGLRVAGVLPETTVHPQGDVTEEI